MTWRNATLGPRAKRKIALRLDIRVLGAELMESLRVHAWFIALILGYTAAGLLTAWFLEASDRLALWIYTDSIAAVNAAFFLAFIAGYPIYVMVFVRPARLTRHMLTDLRSNYLTRRRLLLCLPIILLLPLHFGVFTSLKSLIPVMQPYAWDVAFAEWDKAIHGGFQPWQLLQPVLGHPLITKAMNLVYNVWFVVLHTVLLWQAFSLRDRRLRMQFFLTFVLAWILLGTVAATLLSSAGPCYYGRVTGLEDPFAPLMAYLGTVNESYPLGALGAQEYLWNIYQGNGFAMGSGISAMPSMHMAMIVLCALVGWRHARILGIGLAVFALLIMIGSVHLGWHYAVDHYVAIAGVWLIWRGVGWLLKRDSVFRGTFTGVRPRRAQPSGS